MKPNFKNKKIQKEILEVYRKNTFGCEYIVPNNIFAEKVFKLFGTNFIRIEKLESLQNLFNVVVLDKPTPLFKEEN